MESMADRDNSISEVAIAPASAMIGILQPPSILQAEYENADSVGFIPGIAYLNAHYPHMRRVRGDGNCFYRAFIFSYLEGLLNDYNCGNAEKRNAAVSERDRMSEIVRGSIQWLVTEHSYSEMAIESFQEVRHSSYLIDRRCNPIV